MTIQIKVLGPGCSRCTLLAEQTQKAVDELGIDAEVESVHDVAQMLAYGVMSSPALVVDERVAVTGRVPRVEELKTLIAAAGEQGKVRTPPLTPESADSPGFEPGLTAPE